MSKFSSSTEVVDSNFDSVARFLGKPRSGFDWWRSVSTRSMSGWRGFRPLCSLPGCFPKDAVRFGCTKPFVVPEVVPEVAREGVNFEWDQTLEHLSTLRKSVENNDSAAVLKQKEGYSLLLEGGKWYIELWPLPGPVFGNFENGGNGNFVFS